MTGWTRSVTLLAACGLLAASPAMPSVPSAANHDVYSMVFAGTTAVRIPNHINLVGRSSATGEIDHVDSPLTIIIRDLNNLPVNNSFVVIDFSACHALQLCSDQQPGITVVCGSQQIRGFTGPDGKLVLSIAGGANNSGALPLSGDTDPSDGFAGAGCVAIEADGIPIRGGMNAVTVAAFDQSGMDGVRPSDDACQLGDYFGLRHGWIGRDPNRSDYDGNGMVLPSDRAIYLGVYFGIHSDYQSTSYANCGTGTGACSLIP